MELVPVALLALALSALPVQEGDGPVVAWKGREIPLADLAGAAGNAPATAAQRWAEWATEEGYRLILDDTARVLLVVSNSAPNPKPVLARIAETCVRVDAELAAPDRPTQFDGERETWKVEFAAQQARLDRETIVLVQLEHREDHLSCLRHLAALYPYLGGWAKENEPYSGFVIDAPLVAGWVRTEGGDQLFHPENELVNRLARLLVYRRFGQLPHWLLMSLAWHFEMEIVGSLFAFPDALNLPYSADFFGWDDHLRTVFRKRKDEPLAMREVAEWKPGTLDREAAARAWGLTRFLLREHRRELPEALDRLAALFWEKGRVRKPNRVEPIVGFEPSADDQRAVLVAAFGADVLARASESFRMKKKGR